MFKGTLRLYLFTNLNIKGVKRSVNMWAANFYKCFQKCFVVHVSTVGWQNSFITNVRMLYPRALTGFLINSVSLTVLITHSIYIF